MFGHSASPVGMTTNQEPVVQAASVVEEKMQHFWLQGSTVGERWDREAVFIFVCVELHLKGGGDLVF